MTSFSRHVVLGVALTCAGCGGWPIRVASVDTQVPRTAVAESLRALDTPEQRAHLLGIASSPEMKAAEREVVAGVIDGAAGALRDPKRADAIAKQAGAVAGVAARAAVAGAIGDGAAAEKLGPAGAKVLQDDLAPAVVSVMNSPEMRQAIGEIARTVGHEAVLGANQALAEVEKNQIDGEKSGVLASAGRLAKHGAALAGTATWAIGALALMLLAALVYFLLKARNAAQAYALVEKSEEKRARVGRRVGRARPRVRRMRPAPPRAAVSRAAALSLHTIR